MKMGGSRDSVKEKAKVHAARNKPDLKNRVSANGAHNNLACSVAHSSVAPNNAGNRVRGCRLK